MSTFWRAPRARLVASGLALALLAALAILGFAPPHTPWRGLFRPQAPSPLSTHTEQRPVREPPPVTFCVTPQGLCMAEPIRPGDPCSCPDPLHGRVPGHAEWLGRAPVRPDSGDWPERRDRVDPDAWIGLPGP